MIFLTLRGAYKGIKASSSKLLISEENDGTLCELESLIGER